MHIFCHLFVCFQTSVYTFATVISTIDTSNSSNTVLLFLNYLLKSIVSLHKIPFYSVFGIVSDFTVLFKFKTKHWLIMTTIIFVSFQPNNNVTLCLTPDGNYTIQVSTTDVNYTRLFKNGSISTG